MIFFRRIVACVVVLGAVGCGKGDPEIAVPVAEPETVVIGCTGVEEADVDVRTQLVEGGSVHWEKNDEIRLWACVQGSKDFASCVENKSFLFNYYSPSKSRAGFAGTFDDVESTFNAANKYDYYAVSPVPKSAADLTGTRATYTIPVEQTGDYDGQYDILTAELKDAVALKAGDDNPSVNLEFKHHVHLLKFTIKSNAWEKGRPVRAVELTFPRAVVGRLTVDATDPTVNELTPVGEGEDAGKKVIIKFPAGKERKLGDTFYAMIAPTEIGSGETIGMRIIGTLGETLAEIPAAGKSLEAGHSTPVDLNVKAMTTRYHAITLTFTVTDNQGGIGENTLGERVNTVRVIGSSEDTFYKAILEPSDLCQVSGSDLIITVPDEGTSAEYSVIFLPKDKNPDYQGLDELRDRDMVFNSISGQTLEIEYDSARATVKSLSGWKPVQTTIAAINGSGEYSHTLSVPYLVEQDFSTVESFSSNDGYGTFVTGDKDAHSFLNGWTAGRAGAQANTSIRIACRRETSAKYHARVDSAPLNGLLKSTTDIKVLFDWGADNEYSTLLGAKGDVGQTCYIGYVTSTEAYKSGATDGTFEDKNHFYVKEYTGSYTTQPHKATEYTITNAPVDGVLRLTWRTEVEHNAGVTNTTAWLYLDNIKVQLK